MVSIGDKIRAIRKEKGMTQKLLGSKCDMADSAIRKYESGVQTPKIETLQRIANALEVEVCDLLGPDQGKFKDELKKVVPEKTAIQIADKTNDNLKLLFDVVISAMNIRKDTDIENLNALTAAYSQLNKIGQRVAIERIVELAHIPEYQSLVPPNELPESE